MSSITAYKPIRIGRSDGSTEIKTDKHGREPNGPSSDQLDRIANPDDYYELLPADHPITLEWKRCLGSMLQKEHAPGVKSSNQKWFLVFFPENYRLYKHVSPKASSKSKAKSKNGDEEANGEAYLYGYPLGRKKRYKSAVEFFPHLMWLAEDKSEDYGDCTCRHCAPDWVQKVEPLTGREGFVPAGVSAGSTIKKEGVKKESAPVKKEAVKKEPLKKEPVQVKRETTTIPQQNLKVVIKNRPVSQDRITKPPTKPSPSNQTAMTGRPPPPPQPTHTPLPQPTNADQATDALYARFTYRPGEVTWFNRGTAWGLAVVLTRALYTDAQGRPNRPRYLVQPLSHPFRHPETKWLDTEEDLRPWLAWSAPSATHPTLAAPGTNYNWHNIDWKAVAEGRYGPGDAEVDGSIFAAKMIDDSFTLVELLTNNTMTTGERSYNAIYLGGEKVWVGEPVRLRIHGGQDVMVVSQIVEKLKPGSTNIALASVLVVGDVYRWTVMPVTAQGAGLEAQGYLPVRMKDDAEFRNKVTRAKKGVVGQWKLLQLQQRVSIADVKGRWYESSILMPVLRGAEAYALEVAKGEISDVGNWINGREDANAAGGTRVGSRIKDRVEALGKAVPDGTRIGQVVDGRQVGGPPTTAYVAPAGTAGGSGVGMGVGGDGRLVTGVGDGDIAEFMDLDELEDGYARDFVEGGGGRV